MIRFISITIILLLTLTMGVLSVNAQTISGGVSTGEEPTTTEKQSTMTGTLIVLNKAEASASFLNLADGKEFAKVKTGDGPHEAAVSKDGRTVVVCNYGQREPGNTLTVIDISTQKVTSTIDLREHKRPHGIEFIKDNNHVIVTCEQNHTVVIVDISKGEVIKAMDTDAKISHMIAVTPDESRAFVANIGSDSICAFDIESGSRLAEIKTGIQAEGIAVTPDGKEVWVTNRKNNTVSIVDTQSLEILEHLDSPAFPIRVKITPDGKHALVSNASSGDVAIFDVATRKKIKRIKMDEKIVEDTTGRLFNNTFEKSPVPVGILILPDGTYAFIANTQADIITVIDLKEFKITGRLKAGEEPDGLGYSHLVLQ